MIKSTCTQCRTVFLKFKCHSKKTKNPFCSMNCYALWQSKNRIKNRTCSLDGCENKHAAKNLCYKHYRKAMGYFKKSKIKNEHAKIKYNECSNCKKPFKAREGSDRSPQKFCSRQCYGAFIKKPFIIKKKYKKILCYGHHRADKKGYVFEHIFILEKELGRKIIYPEVVHHIDGNTLNNNLDNLIVFKNNSAHIKFHRSKK